MLENPPWTPLQTGLMVIGTCANTIPITRPFNFCKTQENNNIALITSPFIITIDCYLERSKVKNDYLHQVNPATFSFTTEKMLMQCNFFCLSTLISSKWPDIKLFLCLYLPTSFFFFFEGGIGNRLKVIKVMHVVTLKSSH